MATSGGGGSFGGYGGVKTGPLEGRWSLDWAYNSLCDSCLSFQEGKFNTLKAWTRKASQDSGKCMVTEVVERKDNGNLAESIRRQEDRTPPSLSLC